MKTETLIYEKIKNVIPIESEKTIAFVYVDSSSYEIFFYSLIDGEYKQCFTLAEQGLLDENDLDKAFEDVANIIRNSDVFVKNKRNIFTVIIDKTGFRMDASYAEKGERLYQIKKAWIGEHIV